MLPTLWWIATLFFDLVFVWHRYVRHSVAPEPVAQIADQGYVPTKFEKARQYNALTGSDARDQGALNRSPATK
jgi:hypothetical protein